MVLAKEDILQQAKQLIENNDTDGLTKLINDSTIEPEVRLNVWSLCGQKNTETLQKVHSQTWETIVELATNKVTK